MAVRNTGTVRILYDTVYGMSALQFASESRDKDCTVLAFDELQHINVLQRAGKISLHIINFYFLYQKATRS